MMVSWKMIVLMLLFSNIAQAGTLDDFENGMEACSGSSCGNKNAHKTRIRKDEGKDAVYLDDDDSYDPFTGVFVDIFSEIFVIGSRTSMARSSGQTYLEGIVPRDSGSPLLPIFSVSGNYQQISPTILAQDLNIEIGSSVFAVAYRSTDFLESNPTDVLRLTYTLFKYRLSYGNSTEFDIGAGISQLLGNSKLYGDTIVISLTRKINERWGINGWYAGTNFGGASMVDMDVKAFYNLEPVSLALGYRSLLNFGSSLSGLYMGITYTY